MDSVAARQYVTAHRGKPPTVPDTASTRLHDLVIAVTLILVAAALVPAAPARAAVPTEALAEEQLLLVREASRIVDKFGDELWDGWSRTPKPTLLIDDEREYLLNFPPETRLPSGFTPTQQQFMGRLIYSRPVELAATLRTAFPIEGLPTAIVGVWQPNIETPTEWVITLLEQWFHVFQLQRGEDDKVRELELDDGAGLSWQIDYPFPFDDPDVGNAMLLLGQALYDVWSRADELPREGQRDLLTRTAWAALQNLRTVLVLKHGEPAYRFFQLEAWRDGVARYSSLILAREAARAEVLDRYERTDGFEQLAEEQSYADVWQEHLASRFWMIRTAGADGRRDGTSFDAIGHGLAELLDNVSPDWKERYFERGVWLDDLLAESLDPERGPTAGR